MKLILIVMSAILGIVLIGVCCVMSSKNGAISLEESVAAAKSGIDVQLSNRFNKLTELAECVKRYDVHEIVHAVGHHMNLRELEPGLNNEVRAYLTDYLFKCFARLINTHTKGAPS